MLWAINEHPLHGLDAQGEELYIEARVYRDSK